MLALLDDAAWFDRRRSTRSASRRGGCTPRASCCCSRSATSRAPRSRCPAWRSCAVGRLAEPTPACCSATASTPSRRDDVLAAPAATRWRCSSSRARLRHQRPRRRAGEQAFARGSPLPEATAGAAPAGRRRRHAATGRWSAPPPASSAIDATRSSRPSLDGLVSSADGRSSSATRSCARPPTARRRSRGAARAPGARRRPRRRGERRPARLAPRRRGRRAPTRKAAADLERTADRALARGGHAAASAAARAGRRADPDRSRARRRLVAAADAAWLAGDAARGARADRARRHGRRRAPGDRRLRARPDRRPARLVDGAFEVPASRPRRPRRTDGRPAGGDPGAMAASESGAPRTSPSCAASPPRSP